MISVVFTKGVTADCQTVEEAVELLRKCGLVGEPLAAPPPVLKADPGPANKVRLVETEEQLRELVSEPAPRATRLIDMTGRRIGPFKIIARAAGAGGQAQWICQCFACGTRSTRGGQDLRKAANGDVGLRCTKCALDALPRPKPKTQTQGYFDAIAPATTIDPPCEDDEVPPTTPSGQAPTPAKPPLSLAFASSLPPPPPAELKLPEPARDASGNPKAYGTVILAAFNHRLDFPLAVLARHIFGSDKAARLGEVRRACWRMESEGILQRHGARYSDQYTVTRKARDRGLV